ncbi:uncharacterized protein [Aegilops tauschii subsp. strangulata]|uniref:uncharacterized protein isoform X1 n=1 Tax=Aegilops tauschii subsp. strangulata TaxID=200361 RepID=UPI00098A8E90|nr:uncharacterized protein LOC109739225 isoform X1 [Aegilops tauschii subsp. strangulata]
MALADLNFDMGQDFAAEVWRKWGVPINYEEGKDMEEFILVAEFTRSRIRLTVESVATILLSCFGGRASLFKVQLLQNWSFRFSVSSKEVGFSIIKGGNISLPLLNINFLLWGSGGPNSSWELDQYLQEKEDAWTHVFRDHPRKSYLQALRTPTSYIQHAPTPIRSPARSHQQHTVHPSDRDRRPEPFKDSYERAGNPPIQTAFNGLYCVRCLMHGHLRPSCTNRIKCRNCKRWGHIARDCFSAKQPSSSPILQPTRHPTLPSQPTSNATPNLMIPRQITTVAANETNQLVRGSVITPAYQENRGDASISAGADIRHYNPATPSIAQRLRAATIQDSAHSPPLRLAIHSSSPSSAQSMAAFPFDPSPFIPTGHHRVDVAGRPARIRILTGAVPAAHEEWAIATIVPMPNLPVQFATVREVLSEFLTDVKHLRFSEISPCPFGQAYIKFDSVFDRDELVNSSPHPFTDVHVIFEKHNQGLNWRKLNLSREVWILLCGFPLDRRSIHEISNAISKFGKFVMWDRNRSTRANLMVKIKVEELRDIPSSIAIGEGDDTATLSVPVVILQDTSLGREAPDEDPIPAFGNPHPVPAQAHFHQNQHNHFLGPLQFHEQDAVQAPVQNPILDLQLGIQVDEEEDMAELPGWGHWAMPAEQELADQELHDGEFLHLHDLMEPMEEKYVHPEVEQLPANSNVTVSDVPPNISAETANSVVGPLAPLDPLLPDLNADIGQTGPEEPVGPIMAQDLPTVAVLEEMNLAVQPLEDLHLSAILNNHSVALISHMVDPMHFESSMPPKPNLINEVVNSDELVKPLVEAFTVEAAQLEATLPVLQNQVAPIISREDINPTMQSHPPVTNQHNDYSAHMMLTQSDPMNYAEGQGESSSSDVSAPPGFPIPMFKSDHLIISETGLPSPTVHEIAIGTAEKYLGKEGAQIWSKHFAPTATSKDIIQVPVDWVNFLSVTFLSPEKYEWAKQFITSKVWDIISQSKKEELCLPFALPNSCPDSSTLSGILVTSQDQENTPSVLCGSQDIMSSSTSAIHHNRKRKDKGPLVETEVNAQETTEEKLTTKIKKPKVAAKAKEGTSKSKEGGNMSKEGTISAKSGQ